MNCIVFRKFYKAARSEYYFEQAKLDLDAARKENEICKTKYPILMVHGIFFRDWQVINYWGRYLMNLLEMAQRSITASNSPPTSIRQCH